VKEGAVDGVSGESADEKDVIGLGKGESETVKLKRG